MSVQIYGQTKIETPAVFHYNIGIKGPRLAQSLGEMEDTMNSLTVGLLVACVVSVLVALVAVSDRIVRSVRKAREAKHRLIVD